MAPEVHQEIVTFRITHWKAGAVLDSADQQVLEDGLVVGGEPKFRDATKEDGTPEDRSIRGMVWSGNQWSNDENWVVLEEDCICFEPVYYIAGAERNDTDMKYEVEMTGKGEVFGESLGTLHEICKPLIARADKDMGKFRVSFATVPTLWKVTANYSHDWESGHYDVEMVFDLLGIADVSSVRVTDIANSVELAAADAVLPLMYGG